MSPLSPLETSETFRFSNVRWYIDRKHRFVMGLYDTAPITYYLFFVNTTWPLLIWKFGHRKTFFPAIAAYFHIFSKESNLMKN